VFSRLTVMKVVLEVTCKWILQHGNELPWREFLNNRTVTIPYLPANPEIDILKSIAILTERCGAVPICHVPASRFKNELHLQNFIDTIKKNGVESILALGGEGKLNGVLSNASQVLDVADNQFKSVGIAAYPEGHKLISDPVLEEALSKKLDKLRKVKKPFVVTQLALDPRVINNWLGRFKKHDVSIFIGVIGPNNPQSVARLAHRLGFGASKLNIEEQYHPQRMMDELDLGSFDGFQISTFDNMESTRNWIEKSKY